MADPTILVVCDDLIFVSKITATARATARETIRVRDAKSACQRLATLQPGCVIIDLHTVLDHLPSILAAVQSIQPRPYIVAFGSHVDTERLRAARQAGCDLVMPKSQFVERLETHLPQWLPTEHDHSSELVL